MSSPTPSVTDCRAAALRSRARMPREIDAARAALRHSCDRSIDRPSNSSRHAQDPIALATIA
jgi:hypothetical protein